MTKQPIFEIFLDQLYRSQKIKICQTKHYLNTHVPHCAVMDVHLFYEENKELATEHNFQEKKPTAS